MEPLKRNGVFRSLLLEGQIQLPEAESLPFGLGQHVADVDCSQRDHDVVDSLTFPCRYAQVRQ